MRYDTVLFDLDGTLIDSGPLILSSFRHATRTVLSRIIPDDVLMANVGGHGLHAQMAEFDEDAADELVRVYREHNEGIYAEVRAFPGVPELLEGLGAGGWRMAVVTAKARSVVERTFDLVELRGYFQAVVAGDDASRHKPDPEPLLQALAVLGARSATTAVYVGDSPFDIRAARAAGMEAIAVAWGGIHPLERLEAEGPDFVVHSPTELADVL